MDRKVINGYTTIELLIVIAIIGILAGFAVHAFRVQVAKERLRAATTRLVSDINQAKLKSISTGMAWGVRVCNNNRQYKIFINRMAGSCYIPSCTYHVTHRVCLNSNSACNTDSDCRDYITGHYTGPCIQVESLVELPAGVLPQNDFSVVFDRRGYVYCFMFSRSITLRNSFGEQRTIYVDELGRVRYE